MAPSARLRVALAAIDDANRADPTSVVVRGSRGPKEIVHANLVTEWVLRLRPDADEALLLAARGHHFRRWTMPRTSYPSGRAGYLRWRKDLHAQQARELGVVLTGAGYDQDTDRARAGDRSQGRLGRRRPTTTTCRCWKTRSVSSSSRPSSSTSQLASIRPNFRT